MGAKIKTYDNLQELFADGIFQPSDILVFFGKRGKGKTSLQTVFNVWFMQPKNARADLRLCRRMCDEINMAGLNLKPPTDHLVFVDTYAKSIGRSLKKSLAYEFDALDFGLPNESHPTGLLCPCGKYSFDEGQKTFNSHMGHLATFLSAAMELSRQPELFIMISIQRPMRLQQDIRDLSTFIKPIGRQHFYNKHGRLIRTEWTCLIFYENAKLENYLKSADDTLADKVIKIAFNANIYRCYNPRYHLASFYAIDGTQCKETTLRLDKCKDIEFTPEGLKDFHERHPIDLPDTLKGKQKKENKS